MYSPRIAHFASAMARFLIPISEARPS
jgi:hypothetical protein